MKHFLKLRLRAVCVLAMLGAGAGVGAWGQSLKSITVSPKYLVQGTASFVSVVTDPPGVVLPDCKVSESTLLVYGDLILDDVFADPITSKRTVTVTCGSATATFDFLPYGQQPSGLTDYTPAGSAVGTESTSADGNLVLNLKLSPNAADVGKSARVWVTASMPPFFVDQGDITFCKNFLGSGFFGCDASQYPPFKLIRASSGYMVIGHALLDPDVFPTLTLPDMDSVTFTTIASLGQTNDLVIPTLIPKAIARDWKMTFSVGYQVGTGKYVNLGQAWQ